MNPWLLLLLVAFGAYLIGSIPFGWLVGKAHGKDIRKEGSGNIGATNVGRILGRPWGILVFVLDFAKGALPVWLAGLLDQPETFPGDTLKVVAGTMAFIGHLAPVWLGFRGGKGVATGAGVIFVLMPLFTVIVLACWAVVRLLFRIVSLASLVATLLLVVLRLTLTEAPWSRDHLLITLFCVIGVLLVWLRHLGNIKRLIAGTEPRS